MEKIASVIVASGDFGKGVAIADVLRDGDIVHFPCVKERIGGICFKKKVRKKGRTKRIEISVSFTNCLKELKKMKCKEIEFQDGLLEEV